MTVAGITDSYQNLVLPPFSVQGGADIVDDQFGPDRVFQGDKVDKWASSTEKPIPDGSVKFSMVHWVYWDGAAGAKYTLNQRPNSGAGQYYYTNIHGVSGRMYLVIQKSGAFFRSATSAPVPVGAWTMYGFRVNLASKNIDIFKNGIQESYFLKNNSSGSTNATMTVDTLGIGSFLSDVFGGGFDGLVSWPVFAEDKELSDAEFLQHYNDQVALIGSGFGSQALGGEGRPDFRNRGMFHELEWNRGVPRFQRS